jgi:hypothetical protein
MLSVDIDFGLDRHRPLGWIVGSLTRELWLCDLDRLGVKYVRVSDSQILISERDYTRICLTCLDPDLDITCSHVV